MQTTAYSGIQYVLDKFCVDDINIAMAQYELRKNKQPEVLLIHQKAPELAVDELSYPVIVERSPDLSGVRSIWLCLRVD